MTSRRIVDMPVRPQRSKNLSAVGTKVMLTSNHFGLDMPENFWNVYIYRMDIFDEENEAVSEDARNRIASVTKRIQGRLRELFDRHYISGINLWTNGLCESSKTTIVTSVYEKTYTVKLKLVRQTKIQDLMNSPNDTAELSQILNIVVKSYLNRKGYEDVGANQRYYKVAQKGTVVNGMQILEGFFTSIHIINHKPILLIDFVSRILRNETLLQVLQQHKTQDSAKAAVRGLQVMAKYGSNRLYKVLDVDFTKSPSSVTEHDSKLTYAQYFMKAYNLKITNSQQPLVLCKIKSQKRVYLVPELLRTTGLTDAERANGKLMIDVAQVTKKEAKDRNNIIMNCARDLRGDFNADGYKIAPIKNLEGIVLHPPQIKTSKWEPTDNRRNININKLLKPTVLASQKWIVIYRSLSDADDDDVDLIISELQRAATKLGAKFAEPFLLPMNNTNPKAWVEALKEEIDAERPPIVLSVINEKTGQLYQAMKQYLLKEESVQVPHQNIQSQKFLRSKNKMSQALKIVQQMNIKMGCPLWQVEIPASISPKTMLVGLDVYHKTIVGKRSVAGLVASMDSTFTRFWSTSIVLGVGQELTHNVAGYFAQALVQYQKANSFLPDTIIFYRDGVGESQVQSVLDAETQQIQQMFSTLKKNYHPAFAQILINKRIRHRFFSDLKNPTSGTIVHSQVVEEGFNFKMIAQNVTSGTATPTSYQLIANNTDLKEDTLWQLTYWQCFNYANWQGPVRVPAVVQYAHKLAYMVGEQIQQNVPGSDQLYYL